MRRFKAFRAFIVSSPFVDLILLSIMAGLGYYMIAGIFRSGLLYQWDLSQHFVESYYSATVLLPDYHQLIGWNPYYYLGYPQGQFDPPMGYAIYAVLYYALSWAIPPLVIYKVMIAMFFIAPAFFLYFAVRLFGLSRLSGFFAGIFAIGTAGGFEQSGPLDIMEYGMYEYTVAIALIPLILALFHLSFQRRSWPLFLAVGFLTAFDFLLHTIAGVFLTVVLAVYAIFYFGKRTIFARDKFAFLKVAGKFGLLMAIVFGLCAFWVIPAFVNQSFYVSQKNLVTELGNYGTTYNDIVNGLVFGESTIPFSTSLVPNLHPVLITSHYSTTQAPLHFSSVLFYQVLLGVSLAGIVLALIRRQFRLVALVSVVSIAIFFFISLGPGYYEVLWHSKLFQLLDLRPARAAAPARIFLLFFAGLGLGESLLLIFRGLSRWKMLPVRVIRIASVVLILLFAISLFSNSISLVSQLNLGSTTNDIQSASAVNEVFQWVQQNVPNTSRVAYEEYPKAGQHLMSVSPYFTGRQAIGSEYGFWWVGADASTTTTEVLSSVAYYGDFEVVATLKGLDADYVVAWNSETKLTLEQDGEYNLVKQFGIFDIFQIANYTPSFVAIDNGSGNATVTSFDPESISVHVANVTAGSSLLIRVEYYSDWTASSSLGEALKVEPDSLYLPLTNVVYMQIPLTAAGTYDVNLHYTMQKSDKVGEDLSFLTSFIFAIALFFSLGSKYNFMLSDYLMKYTRRATDFVRINRNKEKGSLRRSSPPRRINENRSPTSNES